MAQRTRGIFWLALRASRVKPLDAALATPIDRVMMHTAIHEAKACAAKGEAPVGCVIYETATGRVLAHCGNARETQHDATAHAEVIAIRAAGMALGSWRLNNCTLVVTLEPCVMCAGAIISARVGRVVFGAFDPKAGFVGSLANLLRDKRLNHRVDAIGGVEAQTCGRMLKDFFQEKRKKARRDGLTHAGTARG